MNSLQRQELILEKMKAKGIEVGSGVPDKKYDSEGFIYSQVFISVVPCDLCIQEYFQVPFTFLKMHV